MQPKMQPKMHDSQRAAATPLPMLPDASARAEILRGLSKSPKMISPKYFYDARGSELFEQICELPEYYVTRAELAALRRHLDEIAAALGSNVTLIEPGAGAGTKVRMLLGYPGLAAAYFAVDICRPALARATAALRLAYPRIDIRSVCADFTAPFEVPMGRASGHRRVVFFPGSTIGNFSPEETVTLLRSFREIAGEDGGILIGVDLYKSPSVLVPAYNDAAGVTALFNLNLLYRLNSDFAADFRPERFAHRAVWNEAERRIEMRLISRVAQAVWLGPHELRFAAGEPIVTEYSYKHRPEDFAALAAEAGLTVQELWMDPGELFSIQYLRPSSEFARH